MQILKWILQVCGKFWSWACCYAVMSNGGYALFAESDQEGDSMNHATGDVAPNKPLTAVDRCDRCGAQAYVRAVLAGGGDLLFCAHHGREFGGPLRNGGADIYDESDRLTATPTT